MGQRSLGAAGLAARGAAGAAPLPAHRRARLAQGRLARALRVLPPPGPLALARRRQAAREDAAPAGAGCTAAPSPADAGDLAAPPPPIADELTAAPAHAAGPAAHDGLEDAEACNEDPGTASFAECADAPESATAESATAETRRVLSTIKALREQVAGLQSELRLSESDRVSQLRQEFNIALDVALDASRSFRQAVLVGDRLHALVETANEMLTRNQCSLPLDDLLRWQTLHKTMVRALVESGEKLRALKSANPGVQSVVRICETPGLRQQGDSE